MIDYPNRFSCSPARFFTVPFSFVLLAATIVSALGCSRPGDSGPGKPSKTVDVPPALEISTENDEVAAPRTVDVAGLMPSNFPDDLPLHMPSSLVNFGDDEQGAWVELLSDDPRMHVEQTLTNRLRAGGWSARNVGSGSDIDTFELRRSGYSVKLIIRQGNPGTLYRYEY